MKLIRLDDKHYVLDAGNDIRPEQLREIQDYLNRWWAEHTRVPTTVVFGGLTHPLEFEDRRETNVEQRLKRLERDVRAIKQREPA